MNVLESIDEDRLRIFEKPFEAVLDAFARDVRRGLTAARKFLPPKYFYDERGSQLFDRITQTKEYYPTNAEAEILRSCSAELSMLRECWKVLVELGSGTSEKTRILLDAFTKNRDELHYVPIDVSDILVDSSRELLDLYPNLRVEGVIAEYRAGLKILNDILDQHKLILFLGSSIGNFTIEESTDFLGVIRSAMNEKDALLIGFDMVKDIRVLEAAYNDSAGVTAAFNMNVLRRINDELGGNFDLQQFNHHAFFNARKSRIEMHLVSKKKQQVNISALDLTVSFEKDESIHTENSKKFTPEIIDALAEAADFTVSHTWQDSRKYFSLCLFIPE